MIIIRYFLLSSLGVILFDLNFFYFNYPFFTVNSIIEAFVFSVLCFLRCLSPRPNYNCCYCWFDRTAHTSLRFKTFLIISSVLYRFYYCFYIIVFVSCRGVPSSPRAIASDRRTRQFGLVRYTHVPLLYLYTYIFQSSFYFAPIHERRTRPVTARCTHVTR